MKLKPFRSSRHNRSQKGRNCKWEFVYVLTISHRLSVAKNNGFNRGSDEIVRPRVPLEACLASFSSPEEIHDFYSTALQAKTTATK